MRVWLFALLLVIPFSYALVVESTGQTGENLVMYGELIAYENEGQVHAYDIMRKEEYSLGPGSSPFIFGFTVVFETKETEDLNEDGDKEDTVIQYANVRDKKVISTKAVGHNPSIFADVIIFSTKESELGIDFTNDGDEDDDIVRYYTIKSGELVNTKAVGDFPTLNQKFFVFQAEEAQVDTDLNADGDKVDSILRIYDRESRQFSNVPVTGNHPLISKDNRVVFVSDGKIKVLDARSSKVIDTGQSGNSPSISGDILMFTNDGKLHGWNLETEIVAKLDVIAAQVSVFEDRAAFTSDEKSIGDLNGDGDQDDIIIRVAKAEDIDGDDVSDFLDNCAAVINPDQEDSNSDGIGDACDPEKPKKKEIELEEAEKSNVTAEEAAGQERKGIPWYWYLVIILALPFIVYYGYKYYKKKQKSFGF